MGQFKRIGQARLVVFIALLAAIPSLCSAQDYFPNETRLQAQKIIRLAVMQNYARAEALCKELQQKLPDHPAGYFLQAAVLQSEMLDYEDYTEMKTFFSQTKRAMELAQRDIARYRTDSWPYFFYGAALGYEAFFRAREGIYMKAFQDGWNSIQTLQTVLQIDSTNYDVYLAIGSYKYYRSKYSQLLKWLPFIDDERQEGIAMIRKAIDRGYFSKSAAMNALIWIYIGEEQFAAAAALVDSATVLYPGSRFFLWGKATVAAKQEHWDEAATSYQAILDSYRAEGRPSPYNELVCHVSLAEVFLKMGRYATAQRHANLAFAIKVDKSLSKRAEKMRDRAEKVVAASRQPHSEGG